MSELISFKAAVFDLDGTILDSMSMWRTLLENALLRHGIYPEPLLSLNIWGIGAEKREIYLKDRYGLTVDYSALAKDNPYYIKKFYKEEAAAKPGSVEFIKYLKNKGIKIALATATPIDYMESALDRFGIKNSFDFVITTKDIGVGKFKPDIYDISCRHLGVDKSDAVVFEDAYYAVNTAKSAGYKVIAIDDYWQFENKDNIRSLADRYIESWSEVYDLISI